MFLVLPLQRKYLLEQRGVAKWKSLRSPGLRNGVSTVNKLTGLVRILSIERLSRRSFSAARRTEGNWMTSGRSETKSHNTVCVRCVGHLRECHAWRGSACTHRYVGENATRNEQRMQQRGERMKEKEKENYCQRRSDNNFSNLILRPEKLNYERASATGESTRKPHRRVGKYYIFYFTRSLIF